MTLPRLLTPREVADQMNVHPRTVQRWAREQTIPSIRIGKLIRFNEADLAQWLEASRTASIPNPYYRPYPHA